MQLPVYMNDSDFAAPPGEEYYLLAANGVFIRKKTRVCTTLAKVDGVPWLREADESDDVPAHSIARAHRFFARDNQVFLYDDTFEAPPAGEVYYLLAGNGIFVGKDGQYVKVDGVPGLLEADEDITPTFAKVPGSIIARAHAFFAKVFAKHGAESYVTLMYSRKTGEYSLWCPKQRVSRGGVRYERNDQPPFAERKELDLQMVGTIHSHCDFSAFHSGTDVGDEEDFDGLHITIGHVNTAEPSMVASIAVNGQRKQLRVEDCCTGVRPVAREGFSTGLFTKERDHHYKIVEAVPADAVKFIEDHWMPKVETWGGLWQGKGGRHFDDGGTFREQPKPKQQHKPADVKPRWKWW